LEKRREEQTRTESKTRLVEQINIGLHSGDYSRALDLLRGTAAEFPNDAELSELEKLAHDGVKRNAEANRLITGSQELFAQRKPAEAIQLLRQAYQLDERNSLARAILANALVEHAHSVVETDWLEAETLTNQALDLNPAHPTAKTLRSLIVEQKRASSVEGWVARARKLQSSGDPFAALAWVAEGLAVHPDDPKLLEIHDAIQRDQGARRRQARRGDLQDLQRMELEIEDAADAAAKQACAERIQAVAAKYWTDGEILSVANRLLHRLGFVPRESSTPSPHGQGAAVIFHVPRPSAPQASRATTGQAPPSPVVPSSAPPSKVPPSIVPPGKVLTTPPEPQLTPTQTATVPAAEPSAPAAKVTSPSSQPKPPTRSNSTRLILVSTAAIILVTATFFLVRKHHAPPVAKTPSAALESATRNLSKTGLGLSEVKSVVFGTDCQPLGKLAGWLLT
jgi:tetratricopeptide (TPR) repeat protein